MGERMRDARKVTRPHARMDIGGEHMDGAWRNTAGWKLGGHMDGAWGHTVGHTAGHIGGLKGNTWMVHGRTTERRTAGRTEERTVACQDGNWGDTWKVHGDTRWGTQLDAEEDIGRTRRITQRNG